MLQSTYDDFVEETVTPSPYCTDLQSKRIIWDLHAKRTTIKCRYDDYFLAVTLHRTAGNIVSW